MVVEPAKKVVAHEIPAETESKKTAVEAGLTAVVPPVKPAVNPTTTTADEDNIAAKVAQAVIVLLNGSDCKFTQLSGHLTHSLAPKL